MEYGQDEKFSFGLFKPHPKKNRLPYYLIDNFSEK